jgi:holo-[acyl-carrier protein] synthase
LEVVSYTGIDIIEIGRIQEAIGRWGERFLHRIYTDEELRLCDRKTPALAVRFAGKEAVMKLLGTGARGVGWRDIEVLANPAGKPVLNLHGRAQITASNLGLADIAVSLAHSRDYAIASAVANAGSG